MSARNYGLWATNGPPRDLERMIDLVRDGAYVVLHEAHGAEQARAIAAAYPGARILVRHHQFSWPGVDPVAWAREVVSRMQRDYKGITVRLVGANEPNLEPAPNFAEENYRAFGRWYQVFAREVRRLNPSLLVHFPAWAAGHSEDQNDLGFIGYLLPEVREAISLCHAVNCHCYWDVNEGPLRVMGNYGGGLRYRKVRDLLRANGLERPIWVDEAGPWGEPWRVEQVAAHSEAVYRDGILGCTYFLWADPTNNPGNTINQWLGRVPDSSLSWLAREWERIQQLPVGQPADVSLPSWIVDVSASLPRHPELSYSHRDLAVIREIVIHHSGRPEDLTAEAIARYHVASNGWPGIGYHYYVRRDGTVMQTNGLDVVSYHVAGRNTASVGICFSGDMTIAGPTEAQLDSGRKLVAYLLDCLGLAANSIKGHGDIVSTVCPGGAWWKQLLAPAAPAATLEAIQGRLFAAAWDAMGIPYNPDSALYKKAAVLGLGLPLSAEHDVAISGRTYRLQAFVGGIVYAEVGNWDNVQLLPCGRPQ